MAVQVETFECSETAAEPIEACEEATSIIDSLGLKGQAALLRVKTDEAPMAARCPYREITKEENFAYRVLCPHSYSLKEYARSPIPLRVLQIAAHAKTLGVFKEFHVWDAESAIVPDPVLIATAPGVQYEWQTRTFILARWGEVLEPLVVLLQRACERKRVLFRDFVGRLASLAVAEVSSVESLLDADIIEMGPDAKYELTKPRR